MLSIALDLGENSAHNFTDTPENAWYDKHLGNVKKYALFPDESYKVWFKPSQPVTRYETAIAIYTIIKNQ